MADHLSTNRARRRLTSLIKAGQHLNVLTIQPDQGTQCISTHKS